MKRLGLVPLVALILIVGLPATAHAQEATLSGTVSDATGGALPGVTVRAVHEASGNSFEAVTDERGDYRIPARVGAYRLTAELPGFAPVTRTVTMLVGQTAVINLQMALSGVQESVTVTGEAPLLDVTQSSLGGNIDPLQTQELPLQGRNWLDLVALAPGASGNTATDARGGVHGQGTSSTGNIAGHFSLNIDGQTITQLVFPGTTGTVGQAKYSRDAIAEFEYLSSRFDATQGRSTGIQVNAVTKSGANTPSGSFSGYFRHDKLNAADHVINRVLTYQNQQLSGTFGGPIRRDRVHFFANYEYEREPQVAVYNTAFPHLNLTIPWERTSKVAGLRLDTQISPKLRFTARGNMWIEPAIGGSGSSTTSPSSFSGRKRTTNQVFLSATQVISNQAVNEVKAGYAAVHNDQRYRLKNPNSRFFPELGGNAPSILLQGLTAGGSALFPVVVGQNTPSLRDDFTYSFAKGGRHTMKMGAEWLRLVFYDTRGSFATGQLVATRGPLPVPIERVFPDLFDASTWNLNLLAPIAVEWRQQFGTFRAGPDSNRDIFGAWLQEDWTVSPRLTFNLGVRYDIELNAFGNDIVIQPWLPGPRPEDTNNIQPRLGVTYSVDDRTVLRGGWGIYYGTTAAALAAEHLRDTVNARVPNDGRPDFPTNPWNGPDPTFQSLVARFCTEANPLAAGCVRNETPATGGATIYAPGFKMNYTHQASVGVQRQIGETMAIESDYIYVGDRGTPEEMNVNLSYNPATGANYPFSDILRRPFPTWGFLRVHGDGIANTHAWQTALTKRMSNGWQMSSTYTLGASRNRDARPHSGYELVPFPVAPDLGGEYGLAIGDQRHRAVVSGIWQLPYALQVSGVYFFGSGERSATTWSNADLRQIGSTTRGQRRLRPDGTIIPRNNFVGKAVHRVDLRLQRRFPLGGRAGIDGQLEVFNVFNHANFGSYTTLESSPRFGQPTQNGNIAYAPRTLQLGFRLVF